MVVKSLVSNPDIDSSELAYVLFPSNLHPRKALSRLCDRGATSANRKIKEDQIKRLAAYLGVSMVELFSRNQWENFQRTKSISFKIGDKLIILNLILSNGYLFSGREEPKPFTLTSDNPLIEAINEIETKL